MHTETREAGFTLIELMIVIAIIAIIAAIAIPNLIEARKGSNESSAIGTLRTIGSAQHIFQANDKDKNGAFDYATSLSALASANLIDQVLATGTKSGYLFRIGTADAFFWEATADPQVPGKSGDRYFYVDESGAIRFSTSGTANSASTAVGG